MRYILLLWGPDWELLMCIFFLGGKRARGFPRFLWRLDSTVDCVGPYLGFLRPSLEYRYMFE